MISIREQSEDYDYMDHIVWTLIPNIPRSDLRQMDITGIYTTKSNVNDIWEYLSSMTNNIKFKYDLHKLGKYLIKCATTKGSFVSSYDGYEYLIKFDEDTRKIYIW